VLYRWEREAQNQWVKQATGAGVSLQEAREAAWSRQYLVLGEALAAFELAAEQNIAPIFILDEADKLEERIEDMLLQLLGRGWAHVPRFGDIGLRNGGKWPISILLSNDIRHDLSAPLRSRCVYSWLNPPSYREEVRILHVRVPDASPKLLTAVVKVINCIRTIGGVSDKPGIRESIDLLQALVRDDCQELSKDVLKDLLCFIGKRKNDLANLRHGLARLEVAARLPNPKVDEWVEWALSEAGSILEETDEFNLEEPYETFQSY
jgi:MoxR-like ATPase